MSERTLCNYCLLKLIRGRADREYQIVELKLDKDSWTKVYVSGELMVSMLVLTDHCICICGSCGGGGHSSILI